MIDILYLAKGREEFTRESFEALHAHSNFRDLVSSLYCYSDGITLSGVNLAGVTCSTGDNVRVVIDEVVRGGPVAIMNDFLSHPGTEIFAKIDNDVIVPPGWLEAALAVMEAHPELEFLGLEPPASRTANPATGKCGPVPENGGLVCDLFACPDGNLLPGSICYAPCDSIGGVGLMRRSAFANRPPMVPSGPRGVGGFTQWQIENKVRAGWIVPPLKLFLLDRLPFEPWLSLSKRYIAEGQQRGWTNYDPRDADKLWGWWVK